MAGAGSFIPGYLVGGLIGLVFAGAAYQLWRGLRELRTVLELHATLKHPSNDPHEIRLMKGFADGPHAIWASVAAGSTGYPARFLATWRARPASLAGGFIELEPDPSGVSVEPIRIAVPPTQDGAAHRIAIGGSRTSPTHPLIQRGAEIWLIGAIKDGAVIPPTRPGEPPVIASAVDPLVWCRAQMFGLVATMVFLLVDLAVLSFVLSLPRPAVSLVLWMTFLALTAVLSRGLSQMISLTSRTPAERADARARASRTPLTGPVPDGPGEAIDP
jgi:hypothetical protein